MSNPRITFEVGGVKHSLYFGMVATEIISEKSVKAAASKEKSSIKSFAYIVYGGLCNSADTKDEDRPEFEDAYLLAESIATDNDLCAKIQEAWTDSKPHQQLMERLNSLNKKKADPKVKPSRTTGTK